MGRKIDLIAASFFALAIFGFWAYGAANPVALNACSWGMSFSASFCIMTFLGFAQ